MKHLGTNTKWVAVTSYNPTTIDYVMPEETICGLRVPHDDIGYGEDVDCQACRFGSAMQKEIRPLARAIDGLVEELRGRDRDEAERVKRPGVPSWFR